MQLLVTGGAGFIGSAFIRWVLRTHRNLRVVNLDKLTYAANLANLSEVAGDPRYRFVRGDITDFALVDRLLEEAGCNAIVNFAAESHVDRSIADSRLFVHSNIEGTRVLLEAARRRQLKRFAQISTDEVYGSLGPKGCFTETSPLQPSSPYAASKASADLLARAYYQTYGVPVVVTRCCNNYGPHQYPEKLIPLMVTRALAGEPLPVYGDGLNVREWIYVEDHCRAVDLVLRRGRIGEIYNIGSGIELTNLQLVKQILQYLGKPESLISFVDDRPGHDRRYALDASKIRRELGWYPRMDFERGLKTTIGWYLQHPGWWQK